VFLGWVCAVCALGVSPALGQGTQQPFGRHYFLTKDDLDYLGKPPASTVVSDVQVKAVEDLLGVDYLLAETFESAVSVRLEAVDGDDPSDSAVVEIRSIAEKDSAPADYPPARWTGGSLLGTCGCVDDLGRSVVYGFAPFWTAEDTPQRLDFGTLSRVGYFALRVDSRGRLADPLPEAIRDMSLVRTAWKHRAGVDLVLYIEAWPEELHEQNEMLDALRRTVVDLLVPHRRTAYRPERSFRDWAKYVLTLTGAGLPSLADGVTLYMGEGPSGPAAQEAFVRFIKGLRGDLDQATGRRPGQSDRKNWKLLNLMVPASALGHRIYNPRVLDQIVPGDRSKGEPDLDYIDMLLVLLDEPTTHKKTTLRRRVDKEPYGVQRVNMLRKVVPVIPVRHAASNRYQFLDDLAYFQDNFAGVGFWPLPTTLDPDLNDLVAARLAGTSSSLPFHVVPSGVGGTGLVASADAAYESLSRLYCPNRWAARIVFDILAAIALMTGAGSFLSVGFQVWIDSHRGYLWALLLSLVGVAVTILVWDPFWQKHMTAAFLFLVTGSVVGGAVYWSRKGNQAEYP